jgi:hypothetical protein
MLPTDKQARKERPIARGVLDYFPDAIAEVAYVSYIGNRQHNPGEEMHWSRSKSADHADCTVRHLIERGQRDDDGLRHSAKAAWRALALLQTEIEQDAQKAQPVAAVPQDSAWQPQDIHTVAKDRGVVLRDRMFKTLFTLGCREEVAKLIVGGTTFAHTDPSRRDQFIYIAGPMRGYDKLNFPAFDAARDRFLSMGWHVISPADIDRAGGGHENETPETIAEKTQEYVYRDVMALMLIGCTVGGAIAMLPGWHKSTGAVAEFFDSRWLDLTILDALSGMTLQPLSPLQQSELFYTVTKFLTEQL